MKKVTCKGSTTLEIIEGAWKAFGSEVAGVYPLTSSLRSGGGGRPTFPKKRGKLLKRATYAIMYGASDRSVQRSTGLSNRRIRVIRKEFFRGKGSGHLSEVKPVPQNTHSANIIHAMDANVSGLLQAMRVDKEMFGWEEIH